MNTEILKELEKADQRNDLPTISHVNGVITAANELIHCLQITSRGQLIMKVKALLDKKGLEPCFATPEGQFDGQYIKSAFDPLFEEEVNVCIPATEDVFVSFGGSFEDAKKPFWFAYLKKGNGPKSSTIKQAIKLLARQHLLNVEKDNGDWYAWDYDQQINYTNCTEDVVAERVVQKLIEMKNGLIKHFQDKR